MTSLEEAKLCVRALTKIKGQNIRLIKIRDISSIADYFVVASGSSKTQVKALADEVESRLDDAGVGVSHIEGYRSDTWILLDYVDVVVHVFSDEARLSSASVASCCFIVCSFSLPRNNTLNEYIIRSGRLFFNIQYEKTTFIKKRSLSMYYYITTTY